MKTDAIVPASGGGRVEACAPFAEPRRVRPAANSHPSGAFRSRDRGFLLIEVVLGMAILVIVTVGMYRIITASLEAAAVVRESKARHSEVHAFVELMRRTLRTLPNRATVESRVSRDGSTPSVELVLRDAPGTLAFGPSSYFYGKKVLGLRTQMGGLFTLSLGFEVDEEADSIFALDLAIPPPVHLMRDVRRVEWLFFDETTQQWVDAWERPGSRPRLIQINLTIAGEPFPMTAIFWLPPMGETPGQTGAPPRDQPPAEN